MSTPKLLRDAFARPVQALAPEDGNVVTLTAGAASVRGALPADCFAVRIACVNDCYFNFGNSAVVAGAGAGQGHFLAKGVELSKVPAGSTHIAVIQHTAGGVVSVSTMS